MNIRLLCDERCTLPIGQSSKQQFAGPESWLEMICITGGLIMRKSVNIGALLRTSAPSIAVALIAAGCSSAGSESSRPGEMGSTENPGEQTSTGHATNAKNADASSVLLAELTPEANHVIQFWEVSPGRVVVVESAPLGVAPRVDDKIRSRYATYVKMYEGLAGQAAPMALVDAEARQAAVEANLARRGVDVTANPIAPLTPPSTPKGAPARLGSEAPESQSDDGAWFLANFCQPTPQAFRRCETDIPIFDWRDVKVFLTGIGSGWAVGTLACQQFTGRCVFGIWEDRGGGQYGGPYDPVEPRFWRQMSATGVATRQVSYNSSGSVDEPGVIGRVSVGLQWNPVPPPAGDCNWYGKFCCDPWRTGVGVCDTTYDGSLFCQQESNLCVTP